MESDAVISGRFPRRSRRILRMGLIALALVTATTCFYAFENQRAERTWQTLKADLMARGQRFEPRQFILPAVPDSENFLKAPGIVDGFDVQRLVPGTFPTGDPLNVPSPGDEQLLGDWAACRPTDLREWRDVYRPLKRRARDVAEAEGEIDDSSEPVIPLIVIDDTPLDEALQGLARHAEVHVSFDPQLLTLTGDEVPLLKSRVSIRFQQVTSFEALEVLLANHALALNRTPTPKLFWITRALAPVPVWPDEAVDLATLPLPEEADQEVVIMVDEVPPLDVVRNFARQVGIPIFFSEEALMQALPDHYTLPETLMTPRDGMRLVLQDNRLALQGGLDDEVFRVVPDHRLLPAVPLRSGRDVLESFEPFADHLQALYAAHVRPRSRLELDPVQVMTQYPRAYNYIGYRQAAHALALHASAELALHQSAAALQDATSLLRLAESLRGQPDLVPAMMQVALTGLYLQIVWEGLAAQRWSDDELRLLGEQMVSVDLLADCHLGLEAEQAAVNGWLEQSPPEVLADQYVAQMLDSARSFGRWPVWGQPVGWALRWGPRGWRRELQIGSTHAFQDHLRLIRLAERRVDPSAEISVEDATRRFSWNMMPIAHMAYRHAFNSVRPVQSAARCQTAVHQARIACALERFRLRNGAFPPDLTALVPHYFDELPSDLIPGQTMRYVRLRNDQFVLYSVGWNTWDDYAGAGDWVWRYPPAGFPNFAHGDGRD